MAWRITIRLSEVELAALTNRIEQRLSTDSTEPIELTGALRLEGLDEAEPVVVHLIRVE